MINENEITKLAKNTIRECFFDSNQFIKLSQMARQHIQPCELILIDLDSKDNYVEILEQKNLKLVAKIYNNSPYFNKKMMLALGAKNQTGQQNTPAATPANK
jgi:hypothetical protein